MLEVILYVVIGMFIGWNVPMPPVAQQFQTKVMDLFRK